MRIAIIPTSDFDPNQILAAVETVACSAPVVSTIFTQELKPSSDIVKLGHALWELSADVAVVVSYALADVINARPDIIISQSSPRSKRVLTQIASKIVSPVLMLPKSATALQSVVALIDPGRDLVFDPELAERVLRTAYRVAVRLDLPMDVVNVWHCLEEGLLRSWRSCMPEDEIDELVKNAAMDNQIQFNRLSASLPKNINWRRYRSCRGPISRLSPFATAEDAIYVTAKGSTERCHLDLKRFSGDANVLLI